MSDEFEFDSLPPILADLKPDKSYRKYQMTVSTDTFLKLELQAARRGTTSYKLAATIITMFVNGRLKQVESAASPENNKGGS